MADDKVFRGLMTALVTPFDDDQSIDKKAWEKHLDYQLEGGVDGLVVCGTTGESPTFSDEEFEYLVKSAVKKAGGKCPVIAGSGTNATNKSIHRSKIARDAGADGLLIVAPYYNKPTQRGLVKHYTTIADAVDIPLIVYNVPGRTSVNILPHTVAELARHPNTVAVKEASGNISQVMDVIDAVPHDFTVLSGDDAMTQPLIPTGGHGVISVASNALPAPMRAWLDSLRAGDFPAAREQLRPLLPVFEATFAEPNPIPVKAACALMGLMELHYRLPLVPPTERTLNQLRQVLQPFGVLEEAA